MIDMPPCPRCGSYLSFPVPLADIGAEYDLHGKRTGIVRTLADFNDHHLGGWCLMNTPLWRSLG